MGTYVPLVNTLGDLVQIGSCAAEVTGGEVEVLLVVTGSVTVVGGAVEAVVTGG